MTTSIYGARDPRVRRLHYFVAPMDDNSVDTTGNARCAACGYTRRHKLHALTPATSDAEDGHRDNDRDAARGDTDE